MKNIRHFVSLMIVIAFGIGCGNPTTTSREDPIPQRNTPLPTPTRSAPSGPLSDADMERMLPEYTLSRSGAYWIQLDHRELEETTIVVGIEPAASGENLQFHVAEHREAIHYPPRNEQKDSGTIESETLGEVAWSWARLDIGEDPTEEIAIFCRHAALESLLIARFEGPSEGDDVQAKLDELVRVTEIVAQGL